MMCCFQKQLHLPALLLCLTRNGYQAGCLLPKTFSLGFALHVALNSMQIMQKWTYRGAEETLASMQPPHPLC